MAKKLSIRKRPNRASKIITLQKLRTTRAKTRQRGINNKNKRHMLNKSSSAAKKKSKEEGNIDEVSKAFFDAQSSIKTQCCFCYKNITDTIKIILEPIPKNITAPIKKGFLPFELSCINCLIVKIKYNHGCINSPNFFDDNSIPIQYTHYRIINKMEEPIFIPDWSFGKEIKLLGAIERMGLGNWDDISKIIGKGKFECQSHYDTFYYKSKDDYLPKINLSSNTNKSNEFCKKEMKKNIHEQNKTLLKIGDDLGYIPFSIDVNQTNRSININRNHSKSEHSNNSLLFQNACNTLGYCPKRNEFDVEYKNDAELELMEIEFKENDTSNMNDMYDRILSNYNNVLDKREERKKFILEKNLIDVKKQVMSEKKLSKEDREIYQSLKQNIKYLTNEQFRDYFAGVILEKNLRSRLNQLLYYSKIGYKTYDQIYGYINELKQKSNKIKNKFLTNNGLEQLKISLRESTVKQVNKLSDNNNVGDIVRIRSESAPKTRKKKMKFKM